MKLRFLVASSLLSVALPACPGLVRTVQAQSPLAKLTKVQQKVEVSSGAGGAFRAIAQGASIGRGNVVRTGRRSKADVKFSDGSLVRLGQLSSIEVRGPRNVQVGSGQALISWLSPGKIGTSYAAAEIKGTIVNIDVTDEGTTFTLYEGATEIVTTTGNRQELKPGTEVFARPDGTLSGLRTAAPIFFAQAGSPIELLDSPKTGAFVGSVADVQVKASPARVVQRETVQQSKTTEQTPSFQPARPATPLVPSQPTTPATSQPAPQPAPQTTPQPTTQPDASQPAPQTPPQPATPDASQPATPITPPVSAPAPTNPAPTNPAPTNPAPTNPAPTNPAPTNPAPTNPAPTNPAPTNPAPTNPAPTNPAPAPTTPSNNGGGTTTPAPTTPAPTTPAPTTPAPTTPAPTTPTNPPGEVPTTPPNPNPTNSTPQPTAPDEEQGGKDPKKPKGEKDPKKPKDGKGDKKDEDPKKPKGEDDKGGKKDDGPKRPKGNDPKKPEDPKGNDPKKPKEDDKNSKGDDPKKPKDEDPKAPKGDDPKKPKEDDKGGKKDGGNKRLASQSLARIASNAAPNSNSAASGAALLTVSSFDTTQASGRVKLSIPLGAALKTRNVTPATQNLARSLDVQLPPVPPVASDADAQDALNVTRAANELGFDSTRAQERLDELTGAGGRSSGFDARAIGVLGDGGNYAYGARIRGYVARGNFLLDGAVQPLKARAGGENFDLSAVSDLSLTYRTPNIEAQVGRQRFLNGPTQATLYGSLVRQGGREIMDAARVSKTFGSMREQRLDLAYLVDAYPRNLPFRVQGLQQGFLARYNVQKKANLGLNAIKYFDLNRSNQLGLSLDAAAPLGKSGVDIYGEFGRDTYGRNLSSLGLSFPGLYARNGLDVYLEAAYVGSSNNAARPPAEVAVRAYRRVSDNVDLVTSLSRFSNGNTSVLIGLSVGTKRSR